MLFQKKPLEKKEEHQEEHHGLFGHKQEPVKKEEHHGFFSKKPDHIDQVKNKVVENSAFSTGHVDDADTLMAHLSKNKIKEELPEAPLFVKVDKYNDLISILQEMKTFSSSVKNVYNVLTQIEALRTDALNLMKISVQRLEKNVAEMDNELIRPKGIEMKQNRSELDARHIEDSLEDLQKQLATLKTSLTQIE